MIDTNKMVLKRLKEKSNDDCEEVIVRLIEELEKKKSGQEQLMIEGCKEMAEESLRITKEWEATDAKLDWEWDESKEI